MSNAKVGSSGDDGGGAGTSRWKGGLGLGDFPAAETTNNDNMHMNANVKNANSNSNSTSPIRRPALDENNKGGRPRQWQNNNHNHHNHNHHHNQNKHRHPNQKQKPKQNSNQKQKQKHKRSPIKSKGKSATTSTPSNTAQTRTRIRSRAGSPTSSTSSYSTNASVNVSVSNSDRSSLLTASTENRGIGNNNGNINIKRNGRRGRHRNHNSKDTHSTNNNGNGKAFPTPLHFHLDASVTAVEIFRQEAAGAGAALAFRSLSRDKGHIDTCSELDENDYHHYHYHHQDENSVNHNTRTNSRIHEIHQSVISQLKELSREVHMAISSSSSSSSAKQTKEKGINDALAIFFQALPLLEQYEYDYHYQCQHYKDTNVDATTTTGFHDENKGMLLPSLSMSISMPVSVSISMSVSSLDIWEEVSSILQHALLNRNDVVKYTPRKASIIKLQSVDARKYFNVIVDCMALNVNGNTNKNANVNATMRTRTRTKSNANTSNLGDRYRKCTQIYKCLRDFMAGFGFHLHSEEDIGRFVNTFILPILDMDIPLPVEENSKGTEIGIENGGISAIIASDASTRITEGDQVVEELIHPAPIQAEQLNTNHILSVQTAAMECIIRILRWRQHSSALLAPLVIDIDVDVDVVERDMDNMDVATEVANPLRERLLRSIIQILNHEIYLMPKHWNWLCVVCDCLASLLENVRLIDKNQGSGVTSMSSKSKLKSKGIGNGNVNGSVKSGSGKGMSIFGSGENAQVQVQVDVPRIFKWVHKTLQSTKNPSQSVQNGKSLRWHSLDLLRTIIKLHPKSCAQYWALFLPQTNSNTNDGLQQASKMPTSQSTRNVNLITIISISSKTPSPLLTEERTMATLCCEELLRALPLRLWSRSGYLTGRIESSLEQVIASTHRRLALNNGMHNSAIDIVVEESEATYSLALMIISSIPYSKYSSLVDPAVKLMGQIGRNYTTFGLHGGLGLETNVKILTLCMGGIETPNGSITPLPIPTREWFKIPASRAFVSHMLSKITEISSHDIIQKGVQTTLQMDLFIRVVQCAAWLLFMDDRDDGGGMKAFVDLTKKLMQSDDESLQLTGTKLVKAMVEGREKASRGKHNNSEVKMKMALPDALYGHLYQLLRGSNSNSQVRCSALSTYGALHFVEWRHLLFNDYNPFPQMLPMCLEYSGETDSRIRSEACKAVGNIITTCMQEMQVSSIDVHIREKLAEVIEGAIQVTASAVEDSDSNVRSMSLFAMGNIALEVESTKCDVHLRRLPLVQLCEAAYKRLHDDNEKVINNAIRTSGHLFNLYHNQQENETEMSTKQSERESWSNFCDKYALELGGKIEQAILDATDVSQSRSWKQRSNAKKHAWGACQALMSVFKCITIKPTMSCDGVRSAITHLVQCLEHMDRVNEKISLGAASTLSALTFDVWQKVSNDESISGTCLAVSLLRVESLGLPPGMKKLLKCLLQRVVLCIDDRGILFCLSHPDVSQENINYLYNWMVDSDFDARFYDSFARQLLVSPLRSDFSLVQKFQSRAIFEARKSRRSFGQSEEDDILFLDDDSDEDEL